MTLPVDFEYNMFIPHIQGLLFLRKPITLLNAKTDNLDIPII